MNLEVEQYILKRTGNDIFVDSFAILPGNMREIGFLGSVRLLAVCDIEGKVGSIFLKGNRNPNNITIFRYEDNEYTKGQNVTYENPVTISGDQCLRIVTRRGRKKEVFVFMDSDEEYEDDLDPVVGDTHPLVTA